MNESKSLVVFDGDDTLWETEPIYDHARRRIGDLLAHFGVDVDRWEMVERKIDLERVEMVGFSWTRFPRSCQLAFHEVEPHRRGFSRWLLTAAIAALAAKVYWDRPRLMPGAEEAVSELSRSHRLVLMTKGQPWVQRRRIRQSRLGRYFDGRVVTRDKSTASFTALAADPRTSRSPISVGNSFASDVAPALRAGFAGILVETYAWAHESRPSEAAPSTEDKLIVLPDLRNLVASIERLKNGHTD